jgi:hypothetical protein
VPAEHQEEIAEGGKCHGEDDEGLVAAGSGHVSIRFLSLLVIAMRTS